jgi:hypothetical protein
LETSNRGKNIDQHTIHALNIFIVQILLMMS